MRGTLGSGKSKARGGLSGQTGQFIRGNSKMGLCKGTGFTNCQTDRSTKVSLEGTKGTEEEDTPPLLALMLVSPV